MIMSKIFDAEIDHRRSAERRAICGNSKPLRFAGVHRKFANECEINRHLLWPSSSMGLSNTFQRRAAAGGSSAAATAVLSLCGAAYRGDRVCLRPFLSVSKGRNHGFADRDKSRAKAPSTPATLTTYAGTFEKQRQGCRRANRPSQSRHPRQSPRQAVALPRS